MSHRTRRLPLIAALALIAAGDHSSAAQFKADPLTATTLPAKPGPHWVWVNDIVFHHMADGKSFLVDGDSGRMLGMLSTGFGYNGVGIAMATLLGRYAGKLMAGESPHLALLDASRQRPACCHYHQSG